MDEDRSQNLYEATPEQVLYAGILEKGMYFGLLVLLITFCIYVFKFMTPKVPLSELPRLWSLGVTEYLQQTGLSGGWSWLGLVGYGDFLNFIGIAVLAGVTIVCYAAMVPVFLKNNDKIYAVLAVLEVIILCLAASGILAAGH
ncbi:MAG: DUF1634 domain-containing protein [Pseudomonadota bacterium]